MIKWMIGRFMVKPIFSVFLGVVFLLTSGQSLVWGVTLTPPYTGWRPDVSIRDLSIKPSVESRAKMTSPKPSVKKPEVLPGPAKPSYADSFKTEEYVVQEGDWIAKILREKGVLDEKNLPELLKILRDLNQSMEDFDVIQPGERIVILVKVNPPAEKPQIEEKPDKPKNPESPQINSGSRRLKSTPYRIKRGDMLSHVAMNRFGFSSGVFAREYLDLFKECNPTIDNPNRVFPGQVVKLPLYPPEWTTVPYSPEKSPVFNDLAGSNETIRLPAPTALPEKVETRPSAVAEKPMPSISKTVQKTTSLPAKPLKKNRKKTVPPAEFSEKDVMKPLQPVTQTRPAETMPQKRLAFYSVPKGLGDIVPQMGEQWIHSGEHFIPLKSGGYINLKADAYPIIKLNRGITLIVDLHNTLPPRVGRVIESSWDNYKIVHLSRQDDLKSAMDKVLKAFNYPKMFKAGEPLKLTGNIPVTVTGDWIVSIPENVQKPKAGFMVINLLDDPGQTVPRPIKAYLNQLGVDVIEYPQLKGKKKPGPLKLPETVAGPEALIEMVLTMTGYPHEKKTKIPAFESVNDDFKLTVTADFYLTANGRERIIDLNGVDPEVAALLKDRGTAVLNLSGENDPVRMAGKVLKFVGWQYDEGPLILKTGYIPEKSVQLTLAGIVFQTKRGHSVFMTGVDLPPEVASFLFEKGYRVVMLMPFFPGKNSRAQGTDANRSG